MRKVLLASAAVAALLAGPTLAVAQNPTQSQQPAAASPEQQAPKAGARDEKARKGGQASERKDRSSPSSSMSEKSPRAGEEKSNGAQKSGASEMKRSTTGQAPTAAPEGKSGAQKSGTSDMKKSPAEMKKDTTGASQGASDTQGAPEGQKSGQPKASSSSPKKDRATSGQSSDQPKGRTNNPSAQPGRADQAPTGATGQTNQSNQPSSTQGSSTSRGSTSSQGSNTNQGSTTSQSSTTQSSTGTAAAANPQVQTKFNEVIEKQKVQSTTNVNISVSVGSPVPRSVRVYDVPRDIVTIYPEYRGKKFTVIRDEIVIIEPRTNKVVTVIPRSGRSTTGATTSTTSSRLQLPPEKRRIIRETVLKEQSVPRCQDVQVQVGAQVSRTIRFNPFPEQVVREVPEIRSYQFCVKDNDVVLVDPNEYRVVEVID